MNVILLDNWSITRTESRKLALAGQPYGHLKIRNGAWMRTSPVISLRGNMIRTKSGNVYHLGRVLPYYEKHFPDAKETLWKTLNKVESSP